MATPLSKKAYSVGESQYYSEAIRQVLEDHMTYLRERSEERTLDPTKANLFLKYKFDVYGFLAEHNVEPKHYWIVMRVNNIYSPQELPETMDVLLIPPGAEIDKIIQAESTGNRT